MTTQETFGDYVGSLPVATGLNPADQLYLRQVGTSKRIPASLLPSGGGGTTVTTISSLTTTLPSVGLVWLSDPIRYGAFLWVSGDHTTAVANDPGQGMVVALASDPTGATGAWVRLYDGVKVVGSWWGYNPDATPTVDPWSEDLFTETASGTSGTPQLTGLSDTSSMIPGMTVIGTNVQIGALIFTVDSGSQVTLTKNLSGNITSGSISFSGPVPGTGTDNSVAFINIGKWGRGNGSLNIKFPPGTALWDGSTVHGSDPNAFHNTACYWANGIKDLRVEGPGAIWQNTYNESVRGANSAANTRFPISDTLEIKGYLINNTVIGANSFTLINSGDVAASGVAKDAVLAIACNDSQTLGYPPNPGQFEFLTPTGVVGTTVNVLEKIKYIHRTDFADYNATPGINSSCGAARMWVMPDPAWQGTLEIDRLTCNLTPGILIGPYVSVVKNRVITRGWRGPGFSESFCRNVDHYDLEPHSGGETDKFVDRIIYRNAQGGAFPFQSANPNKLIFEGGHIASIVGVGKQTLARGTQIDQFQLAAGFGMSTSTILEGCDITTAPSTAMGNVVDGAQLQTIDGTNASWANGFITLLALPLSSAGILPHWNVTPGMWVNLQNNFNVYSGTIGTGFVLGQTWNPATAVGVTPTGSGTIGVNTVSVSSTTGLSPGMAVSGGGVGANATIISFVGLVLTLSVVNASTFSTQTLSFTQPTITIETTLKQYATLPTWCSGKIWLFKCNELIVKNCIGADTIRQASDAYNAGQRYFEYRRTQFGGINGQNLNPITLPGGELLEVDVNVVTASSVANAVLSLVITTYQNPADSSSLFVNDTGSGTVITIRLDIAGRRKITQTAFEGYPTGSGTLDHITVNNVASDFLGTNRVVGPTMAMQFFSQAGSTVASPVGEVIMKLSSGMVRTPLTRLWDDSGTVTSAHEFVAIQGSLP